LAFEEQTTTTNKKSGLVHGRVLKRRMIQRPEIEARSKEVREKVGGGKGVSE
jgi:hypothetical protein